MAGHFCCINSKQPDAQAATIKTVAVRRLALRFKGSWLVVLYLTIDGNAAD
jgi:hypothetical protein